MDVLTDEAIAERVRNKRRHMRAPVYASGFTAREAAQIKGEAPHLERLLHRLRPYGERVSIVVDPRLQSLVVVDSSVFNLVLAATAATSLPG